MRLLADLRCEKFYLTGAYETPLQHALAAHLRTGMTFWDVGAHAGFFTLLAARLVGPSGSVHAFEPMPANRMRVETAAALNGLSNVTIHDCALASTSGDTTLYSRDSTSMWTIIEELGEEHGITVPTQTIDELVELLGAPDVIKLDVEGAEVDVLRGGSQLFAGSRPPTFVEFSDLAMRTMGQNLLPSYRFRRLTDRHWLVT